MVKNGFTLDDFRKKRRMHRGSPRGVVHIEPVEPLGKFHGLGHALTNAARFASHAAIAAPRSISAASTSAAAPPSSAGIWHGCIASLGGDGSRNGGVTVRDGPQPISRQASNIGGRILNIERPCVQFLNMG